MNEIIQIIKERRNTKNFVDKDVSKTDIETLLDAAIWAPNHRDTQPWRFVVIEKESPLRDKISEGIISVKEHSSGKRQTDEQIESIVKYVQSRPVLIFVFSLIDSNPIITEENYGAVCCAIQNISLAATSMDLAVGWSTGKIAQIQNLTEMFELKEELKVVGVLTIGYPSSQQSKQRTDFNEITSWL